MPGRRRRRKKIINKSIGPKCLCFCLSYAVEGEEEEQQEEEVVLTVDIN